MYWTGRLYCGQFVLVLYISGYDVNMLHQSNHFMFCPVYSSTEASALYNNTNHLIDMYHTETLDTCSICTYIYFPLFPFSPCI